MVMMVLLNEAWTCAMPSATFFLTFLRARWAALFGPLPFVSSYAFGFSSAPRRPCADPCGYGHWCGYADRASAGPCDDAATIATKVHQTLDVHRGFTTQVTFDRELADFVTKLFQVGVGQVLDLLVKRNTGGLADLAGARRPIP
jgi:hypothetical protein